MVQVSKSDPKVFRISVLKATRSFTFRCENEENAKDWIKLIHEQILTSKGHSKVMTKTSIQEKFWKFDRISPQQLAEISDTGDIILFRSYDFICKLQRSLTCRNVGIKVLKNRSYWINSEI